MQRQQREKSTLQGASTLKATSWQAATLEMFGFDSAFFDVNIMYIYIYI